MPARLYVWPNNSGLGAAMHPGHAALEIDHAGRQEYISWWPSGAGEGKPLTPEPAEPHTTQDRDLVAEMNPLTRRALAAGTFAPRPGQEQADVTLGRTVHRDYCVQRPAHTVLLHGAAEVDHIGVGLNLERICDWWGVFRRSQTLQYQFVSQTMNCASVVGTALMVGGATLFTGRRFNQMSHLWHTPLDVLAFAEEINQGMRQMSRYVRDIQVAEPAFRVEQMPSIAQRLLRSTDWRTSMATNNLGEYDLMNYDNWVALSDQHVKRFLGFARRKEQVAQIDTLLQEYHNLDWVPAFLGGLATEGTWVKKVDLLNKMLVQVHEHMREKPQSDRAEAVFILGKQLVDVLDRYKDLP